MRWSRFTRLAIWTTVGIAILLFAALYTMLWIADHIE
jgi:hypothetical protein